MSITVPPVRTPYDELAEPAELRRDCEAARRELDLRPRVPSTATLPGRDVLAAAHLLAQAMQLEEE